MPRFSLAPALAAGAFFFFAPALLPQECPAALAEAREQFLQQNFPGALAAYERAALICPPSGDLLGGLMRAQMLNQRPADAVRTAERWLQIEPNSGTAWRLKGEAHYLAGEDSQAEQSLLAAIAADPRSEDARYALARVYYQQSRYEQAAARFRQALEINPKSYRAHDNLGLCLEALGETKNAVAHYLKAIELVHKDHPSYEWPYINLAGLLLKSGDARQAFDLAAEAAQRNPANARGFYVTAKALLKLDQREKAEKWLRQAADLEPDYPEPHYLLGQILRDRGDAAGSKREFGRFEELRKLTPANRR